jgi:hypothetical protein
MGSSHNESTQLARLRLASLFRTGQRAEIFPVNFKKLVTTDWLASSQLGAGNDGRRSGYTLKASQAGLFSICTALDVHR